MSWKLSITFRDEHVESLIVYDICVRGCVLELPLTSYVSTTRKLKAIPLDLIKEYTAEYIGE